MQPIVTVTMNPSIDLSTAVDKVMPIHKLRCASALRDPGGGGINAARVIARLGGDVTAFYPVGGVTGQLLHKLVGEEGVRGLTYEVAHETRQSFTVDETGTGQQYRFVLPGPSFSDAEWQEALTLVADLPVTDGYLVLSGSLPPGVPDGFYAEAAKRTAGRLKPVVDTSGAALRLALTHGVFLAKPNLRELRELTGQALEDDASRVAACRAVIAAGHAELLAVSLGEDGALLVGADAALRAVSPPVVASSAVGAGDSFVGALVWALAAGKALDDAFRWAVAAGSAAVITPGTELCHKGDVERLYHQVVVQLL